MAKLVAEHYRLEQSIGRGGMKEVWRAVDLRDGSAVAVAIMLDFKADLFRNEVTLARRVTSPYVARVLDGGISSDDQAYLVCELCDGPNLRVYAERNPGLSWTARVGLIHQLSLGLNAVHEACILHRDIKPDNAIITPAGVKLIDFGISMPAISNRTDPGVLRPAGTLAYMAPEALTGEALDARSDVYALGITFYELLAGALPLKADNPFELIHRVIELPQHDTDALSHLPASLHQLVADMVAIPRDHRPYMPAVVQRLDAVLAEAKKPPARPIPVPGKPKARAGPGADTAKPTPAPVGPSNTIIDPSPPRRRLQIPLAPGVTPDRIAVTTWPEAPFITLVPGYGTRIAALGWDGQPRWTRDIGRHLHGALVADLDGDGTGELYVWSRDAILSFDSQGQSRFEVGLPWPAPGQLPWEYGPPTPAVLTDGPGPRELLAAGLRIEPRGGVIGELQTRYDGNGDELVAARGTRGLSCYGNAGQAFRGELATPAAILASPDKRGFHVAHLERVLGSGPAVKVSVYGPGGAKTADMNVATYDYKTAPIEMMFAANSPEHRLFDELCAPLAVAGSHGHLVIVPYLVNAPWFGPVVVAFDSETGEESWRTRLHSLDGSSVPWPPILGVITEGVELIFRHNGAVMRMDATTGELRSPLPATGVPIALGDFQHRGRSDLVIAGADSIDIWDAAACPVGAISWLGFRGDVWRSGCLGLDRRSLGPTG